MTDTIHLSEYQDWIGPLAANDVTYIAATLPRFSLRRALHGSEYVLNPKQFVGVVGLPSGVRLEVHPKVPVGNLFRMLAVAYRLPSPFRDETVALERLEEVFAFIAEHFADLVDARVRAGLLRSYVEEEDNLAAVRGRIMIGEDIRRNVVTRHRLYCRYSEFTWDVPENQIIRQVVALLRHWGFQPRLHQRLAELDLSMAEITPTRLPASVIDRFQYSRFNADYEEIHGLCRLFLHAASLSDDAGTITFRSFLIDMNRLFEQFVTQSLEDRAGGAIRLRTQWTTYLDEQHLVPIRPDIVFEVNGQPVLVADCKYKRTAGSDDYSQLFAYSTALGIERGMLIYPLHEEFADQHVRVRHSRVSLHRRTLDLSGDVAALDAACDALWHETASRAYLPAVPTSDRASEPDTPMFGGAEITTTADRADWSGPNGGSMQTG